MLNTKPDIIIGSETWLDHSITNSSVLPEGYKTQVIRKDRNRHGGGVLIAVKDEIKLNQIKTDANCEAVWGEIQTDNGKVIVGAFLQTT